VIRLGLGLDLGLGSGMGLWLGSVISGNNCQHISVITQNY